MSMHLLTTSPLNVDWELAFAITIVIPSEYCVQSYRELISVRMVKRGLIYVIYLKYIEVLAHLKSPLAHIICN